MDGTGLDTEPVVFHMSESEFVSDLKRNAVNELNRPSNLMYHPSCFIEKVDELKPQTTTKIAELLREGHGTTSRPLILKVPDQPTQPTLPGMLLLAIQDLKGPSVNQEYLSSG